MNEKFDEQFSQQLRQTDRVVQLDAEELTRNLRDRRLKLRRNSSIRIKAAGLVTVCGILCGLGIQQFLPGLDSETKLADPASPRQVATDFEAPGILVGDSNFEITFLKEPTQLEEINELRTRLKTLRKISRSQQLTLAKESISRSLFDNNSTPSLFQ